MKYLLFVPLIIIVSLILLFKGLSYFNYKKLKPTPHEIALLTEKLGDLTIKSKNDILRLQNRTFDFIQFAWAGNNEKQQIIIDSLFRRRKALCYDRSLMLQKIMVHNNIKVVPIYLYYNLNNPSQTNILDFFKTGTHSHNIFEITYLDKNYIIRTNHKQDSLMSLEEFLNNLNVMPKGTKYVRHVNNRHGYFISPSWIPDIY